MRKKIKLWLLVIVSVISLAACGNQEGTNQKKGIKVVTTFYPMYDFTKNIVGDNGQVTMLIDGEEPHDYEPSAKDIASIEEADVFVYNSEEMETWVTSLLKNIDPKKTKIIAASEGISLLKGEEEHDHESDEPTEDDEPTSSGLHVHGLADHYHSGDEIELEAHGEPNEAVTSYRWSVLKNNQATFEVLPETKATLAIKMDETIQVAVARLAKDGAVIDQMAPVTLTVGNHEEGEKDPHDSHGHHHEFDPHVWLDPVLAQQEVTTIAEGIATIDPEQAASYKKNADTYNQKLEELNQAYLAGFKGAKNKLFVTQHKAFAYLANRYNLTQLGISGISPELEPTPRELAEAEHFIKENKVTTIFTESLASPKIAQTVADATGAKMAVLSPLENVGKKERENGLDYIGVMEQNLTALRLVIN